MKKSLPTSTQPQIALTRIYGSTPVIPLDSSNQPQVIPNKVHGVKLTRQVRVRLKASVDKKSFLVRFADFDPVKHARVDAE